MKNFCIHFLYLLMILSSCAKEDVIPVAGIWASVNEDNSVAKLIEFSNGAFIEYTPKKDTKFYYHDKKVWNVTKEDFDVIKYPYCIEEDKLILDGSKTQTTISISSDVLTLDADDYKFVADFDSSYGSEIILNVPKLDNDYLEYSQSSQEIVWDYEISNIPMTTDLAVSSNVNWINNFTILKNQIRFNIDGNTTSHSRIAKLTISHPAAQTIHVTLIQLHAIYAAVVETCSPDQISYTQVTLKGNILEDGNGKIKSRGFYFSANPENLEKYVVESINEDSFTLTINDLQDGCVYYYKAFAENEAGESYGETLSFTTLEYTAPSVVSISASAISYTSAILNGEIANDGGQEITDCGFYYGESQADMTKVSCGEKSGQFSAEIKGLEDGVTYYYQAYALNSEGECKGDSMSFTTMKISIPEVSTVSSSDVSYTSAKVSGSIDSNGGASITEYGFYYWTTSDDQRKVKVGTSTTGAFSTTLSGLDADVTYYYQAYAVNSKGENKGESMSFTTMKVSSPKVSTVSSSDVSYTTAKVSGSIDSNGGSTITEYGFYYSTTSGNSEKVIVGYSTSGSFSTILTGLNENTKYYYRAYAVNSKGVSYGNFMTFITPHDKYNGHAYVDLGLPSGTEWATMNIGASSPYDVGSSFQWGCINTGNQGNPMINYTSCISGTAYDAASYLWGGDWQIPTYKQALELFRYCTYEVIRENGLTYYLYTSTINRNTIILPAANHWTGDSGTYFNISYQRAYAFYGYGFQSESQAERDKLQQLSIRPVCN